jgi:uncharacterized protein (DUF1697 family)
VTRYVALLRAVNVGRRRVEMAKARSVLETLGLDEVSSYLNSGNLLFTATGRTANLENSIRKALEAEFGFELTTFVRTAAQITKLAGEKPFGPLKPGHTHFALFTLTPLTASQRRAVEALTNDHDEIVLSGRDIHWLIRSKSTETTLGPREWKAALPNNPTTARNTTMLGGLITRL